MLYILLYVGKDTEFDQIFFWCRLQAICDTDTEDENDKSSSFKKKSEVPKKNLHRRRLSFSDDESSSTSEFDPGDYVPPKNIYKKGKK